MCGICGIWDPAGVDESVLRAMSTQIRHRGPDDEGILIRGPVGLASRRLSIIDLDHGRQPIANEDESLYIIFNGEIYNYRSLRDELIERGHRFRTHTDTEVILHLYEQEGEACLTRLDGMFCFAIWDVRQRQLFFARDPLGQKPLYYSVQGERLVFGSEAKALFAHPQISAELDARGLHDCISLRCIPGERTLFSRIKKLAAGHWLRWQSGQIAIQEYWDLNYVRKHDFSTQDNVSRLDHLLQETVASHMVSDVPVGAMLSGGIDSSLVVAMMARASRDPVPTFSIGVQEDSFNELPYARQVADRYRTDHHEQVVSADVVALLPRMIYHMEEPVDPFAFGVYAVSRLAAQHVKVILGGDGGDEMFGGYDRYWGNHLVDLYCSIPAVIRKWGIEPLIRRLPDSYRYNNRVQKLRWLVEMSRRSGAVRYAESACYLRFTHERKERLYTPQLWRELGQFESAQQLIELFGSDNARDAVDRMLYTDVKTRLADHLLMVNDRMTMAHGIEGRSPYVDRHVAEFAAATPAQLKVHRGKLKYILRQVARNWLPDELVYRKKQGFSFPLAFWFKTELRGLMSQIVAGSRLAAAGLFRTEAMQELLDEHVAGKVDHNYRLWLLLNSELWFRLFVEGQSIDELTELLTATTRA